LIADAIIQPLSKICFASSFTDIMLPSRLFRNLGIPPALRSLITPHSSLPPTISVQLRLRLGAQPGSLVSAQRLASYSTAAPGVPGPSQDASSEPTTTSSQALPESIVPKLSMTFTCTADNCGERSTHEFSRQAYESGIVLVQCPGCHNRFVAPAALYSLREFDRSL
jgi:protein import protein ZIM17